MKISRKRNGVWLAVCRECDNHKLHRSACNNGKSYRQCKKLKQYIKKMISDEFDSINERTRRLKWLGKYIDKTKEEHNDTQS